MRQRIQFCSSQDGTRIAFATTGRGPPLVRAPNWFTHLEADWESPVWRHWLEALSEQRTLVRYDPRGSGLSDRNVAEFSLDAWVADLEAVADTLGLRRFPLIGLCQGGPVAVAYAARHPGRVSRLILYDSYLHGAFVRPAPDLLARQARALSQMIEVGWGQDAGAFREIFANLMMPGADKAWLSVIGELQRRSASPKNACRLWDAFNRFDIRKEAPKITVPTLIFHVRGDAMVPFEAGRRLAALIPDARFVPLDGANHILLPDEKAWHIFRSELRAFLIDEEPIAASGWDALSGLTRRETEVLDRIARGLRNAEIAEELHISSKTVRNHVSNVFSKLGVEHRAQAIVAARKAGLGHE